MLPNRIKNRASATSGEHLPNAFTKDLSLGPSYYTGKKTQGLGQHLER